MSCCFRLRSLRTTAPALALALSCVASVGMSPAAAQAPAGTVEPIYRVAQQTAEQPSAQVAARRSKGSNSSSAPASTRSCRPCALPRTA
jgi:hypothetical protein